MQIRQARERGESELMYKIIQRSRTLYESLAVDISEVDTMVDLTMAHYIFQLRLKDLLNSDPVTFANEITGIRLHLNRDKRVFENGFVPHFKRAAFERRA